MRISSSQIIRASISQTCYEHVKVKFGNLDMKILDSKLNLFENEVLQLAYEALLLVFSKKFRSFDKSSEIGAFIVQKRQYVIKHAKSIDGTNMSFAIIQEFVPITGQESFKELDIDGFGSVIKIGITLPQAFERHLDFCGEVIKLTFDICYKWLYRTLMDRIHEIQNESTKSLYSYLRIILSSENLDHLNDVIWLGVFTKKYGNYLLDPEGSNEILNRLSKRNYYSDKSPIGHLLNFLGVELPTDKSVSKEVFKGREYLDFSLPKASYSSSEPTYLKTEIQMSNKGKLTVFLISNHHKIKLVANFPTKHKSLLLPLLTLHREKLEQIFVRNLSAVKKYSGFLKRTFSETSYSSLGELIGGIGMGAAKTAASG